MLSPIPIDAKRVNARMNEVGYQFVIKLKRDKQRPTFIKGRR
jgi:hypothetical protein